MYNNPLDLTSQFYKPLVDIWTQRLAAARTAKLRFDKIAKQCTEFYEAGAGFMWERQFNSDYFNGRLPSPKFRITVAKFYEYVSIYGPHLFWQYPKRKVLSQRALKLKPEYFGNPEDPTVQQVFQQVYQQDAIEQSMAEFSNAMMGNYLDWSQREQPGGLAMHGNLCVTEMLIKGMGTLWPTVYSFPGTEQKFTALRYKSVNHFFVDPDCNDPLLETAGYIALRHVTPIWQLEQKFSLPAGTLAGKGNVTSMEQLARNNANNPSANRDSSPVRNTHDRIEWWEIWSKCGVGPRNSQFSHNMIDEFDEVLGDYAYLCIAPGVPFPLNAPPDKYFGENAATPEDIQTFFEWRFCDYGPAFPAWKDGRWPVALLSPNKLANSPWPLAPGAPGLGELIALNILTSAYVDQSWNNRKQLIGYLKSALGDVKAALDSENTTELVPINESVHKSISDVIQYLQAPRQNTDILQAIEMLAANFDKRVGLSELQYGMSSTQIRVASDVRTRTDNANIRPEKMSKDVAAWMSEASQLEMFAALMYVDGISLTHLLGGYGASQWDALLKSMPIEQAMREMKATIEASDIRRPNHERDTANVQSLMQYLMPTAQMYAQETGKTGPLRDFLGLISEAQEMPTLGKVADGFDEWRPPVDEQTAQMQQAQMQAELENVQSDSAQKQAAAQKAKAEAAAKIAEISSGDGSGEGQGENPEDKMREVMMKEVEFRQSLAHKQQDHQQKLVGNQELLTQKLLFAEAQQQIKEKAMREQSQQKVQQAKAQASAKKTAARGATRNAKRSSK